MDPIAVVRLGRTAVEVTRLGLGTAAIGALPAGRDPQAIAVVRHAAAAGIRYIDTAPAYGLGRAESSVGLALPGLDRERLTISTKVGRSFESVGLVMKVGSMLREVARDPWRGASVVGRSGSSAVRRVLGRHPNPGTRSGWSSVEDLTFDGTMRSVETSLSRLQTDHVEILFIHEPVGPVGPVMDGAYRALDRLRHEQRVSAIGVGSNDPAQLEAFARAGDFDCLLVGYRYSLMDQSAGASLLPFALAAGIPVIMGGPFNSGVLADPRPGATYDHRPASAERVRRALALRDIAKRHETPVKAAALQFPFRHPAVVSVLAGASSVAEVDESLDLMARPVPDALWEEYRLDGLIGEGNAGATR